MATSDQPKFKKPKLGRPTKIEDVVVHLSDGTEVTVADRIITGIRAGMYVETAAASAGLEKVTFYDWLKRGAHANTKVAKGETIDEDEYRYALFANAVAQAEAEAERDDVEALAQAARGGHVRKVTTTKEGGKGDPEVTIREETVEANVAALTWRLERRHPSRWGRRQQLEITGADGGPIKVESPLAGLMGDLDAMERRQHQAAEALATPDVPAEPTPADALADALDEAETVADVVVATEADLAGAPPSAEPTEPREF